MPFIQRKLHKKKMRTFCCLKYIDDIPHFYIIWKILLNPIAIVAGYNWILTLASIFNGHY